MVWTYEDEEREAYASDFYRGMLRDMEEQEREEAAVLMMQAALRALHAPAGGNDGE